MIIAIFDLLGTFYVFTMSGSEQTATCSTSMTQNSDEKTEGRGREVDHLKKS